MNILFTILICLGVVVGVVVLLLLIALIKTLLTPSKVAGYKPATDLKREEEYAKKLSKMVQCDTTSFEGENDPDKYREFHKVLKELYPNVFSKLEVNDIDGNLLIFWKGKNSDKPVVLMSHQDVVPAEGTWIHEPFSGDIADGKVWGRGTGDTKCSVMGFFQAFEELLTTDFVPNQDLYISSSCTEEWNGPGCPKIIEELKRRGVKPYLVCDEGGGIITEPVGGVSGNFAMLGVLEKGKADVLFRAKSNGGHASAPPKNTPIARLSAFVSDVERGKLFKKSFLPEVTAMFNTLAPYAGFGLKFAFGNLWLFKPVLKAVMPAISPQAAALLNTTIAFTMQSGSDAYNVIPQEATLGANLRFIPHQGMDESLSLLENKAKEYDLEMEIISASDYCEPVDINSDAFKFVTKICEDTFPGIVTCPYVMTGATDARHYQEICDNVIRFAPVIYGKEQMAGMHGLNENIETACLPGCVDFYKNLIQAI